MKLGTKLLARSAKTPVIRSTKRNRPGKYAHVCFTGPFSATENSNNTCQRKQQSMFLHNDVLSIRPNGCQTCFVSGASSRLVAPAPSWLPKTRHRDRISSPPPKQIESRALFGKQQTSKSPGWRSMARACKRSKLWRVAVQHGPIWNPSQGSLDLRAPTSAWPFAHHRSSGRLSICQFEPFVSLPWHRKPFALG